MTTNSKNGKNIVARGEHGRWLKGYSGGPRRPPGSRNKLSEDFLRDMQEDREQHGKKVIKTMREKFLELYFQSIIKLAMVYRVEVDQPEWSSNFRASPIRQSPGRRTSIDPNCRCKRLRKDI
jgi:hypothetical protein